MTDNQLAILFRAQLLAGMARHGFPNVPVVEAYQPATQGRTTTATIYFFALPERRYGWQGRTRRVDLEKCEITTTELQWIDSGFQVYALSPQDPSDLSIPTAKDLVNVAAMVCNSYVFIQAVRKGGFGVQRVTQVRDPYFVNDQGQFESSPSFDITVTHKRQIQEVTPVAKDVALSIHRV